jgi:YidC/Oxa1 family membrane protein insertase
MEKRGLLAIFLSFLVLYAYQALVVPPVPPATPSSGPKLSGGSASQESTAAIPSAAPAPAPLPVISSARAETADRDIQVETSDVVAVFTNRGARLKSWRLKHYFDAKGQPLEMIAAALPESHPLPFSIRFTEAGQEGWTRQVNEALYVATESRMGGETPGTRLRFEYSAVGDARIEVVKEVEVPAAGYTVSVQTTVKRARADGTGGVDVPVAVEWGPAVGGGTAAGSRETRGGIIAQGGEVERLTASDIAGAPIREGAFDYAGVEDHYFLTAVVAPGAAKLTFKPVSIPGPQPDAPEHELMAWSIESRTSPLRFYAGPKNFDALAAVDRGLVRAINFGMFAVIVVPLLRTLNWIYGYVGNYGWAIVILTLIINVLMFPLRHKQVVSARKMQEIQPEAKAIQERYAKLKTTDPARQKMNQELMALYRERGVNPAAGCLPILLTLPVFLAFFSLLTVAIELRGAPFIGWIRDLSQPDPYYVTPILMGLSQVWLQLTTPMSGADPVQQKMMMLMPVIMMVFFLWSPTGALIYWLVGNVWGIGQQYLTNYLIGPPNVRNVRPAAERRLKQVGSGKTDAASGD